MDPLTTDIPTEAFCFDLAFHPNRDLLVAAMVTGEVHVVGYNSEGWGRLTTIQAHKLAVRSVMFSSDGGAMFTCSSDKTVQCYDTAQQQVAWKTKKRHHKGPVNAVQLIEEGNMIAAGDDSGIVALYDMRAGGVPVQLYDEHGDFVTGFTLAQPGYRLVSSSGDGTIGVYDVRKGKVIAFPDIPDKNDEMLCVDMMQFSNRVVCGTGKGHVVSWDIDNLERLDQYHKLRGNVKEVSTLHVIRDSTDGKAPRALEKVEVAISGARDGIIRGVVITPHQERILGVIGDVGDSGVECAAVCQRNGIMVAACEDSIRWFDVAAYTNPVQLEEILAKSKQEVDGSGGQSDHDDSDDDSDDYEDEASDDDSDGDTVRKAPRGRKGHINFQRDTRASQVKEFFSSM